MSNEKKPDAQIKPGGASAQPAEKPATPPRSRTGDAELDAMSRISRLLSGLGDDGRRRIVSYLAQRYLPAEKLVTENK